jgi:hypothetical protein
MWTNPQIKNHKKSHQPILIKPQTQHEESEQSHLKFLTQVTPSVDKIVNLHGFKYIIWSIPC